MEHHSKPLTTAAQPWLASSPPPLVPLPGDASAGSETSEAASGGAATGLAKFREQQPVTCHGWGIVVGGGWWCFGGWLGGS